jgi:beta-1,4-mannosyltransferase
MKKTITVCCLPIAGIENPYQFLMMKGLAANKNVTVSHGVRGKFFAILKSALSRPDYIHLDWLHQYYLRRTAWMTWLNFPLFCMEILIVRYLLGVKLVWTLHNIMPHDRPTSGPYLWSRRFFAMHCDWVRVFSESSVLKANEILRIKKSKLIIVPMGDYIDYYENNTNSHYARAQLNLSNDDFVILFFGIIRPYKGIDSLIESFKKYKKVNWKLIIAGMSNLPNYERNLRDQIGSDSDILFHSRMIKTERVQDYLNAADVVALPFKMIENSSSAVLAMGFSKPVIAPNLGVLPERLMAQPNLLYDEDLNEVIKKLDSFSKSELEEFGKENYENLKLHGWEKFQIFFQAVPS